MQRALLAALLTGLAAPAIGTYLVQRRLALMGDGIGHIALTGVGVGLLTGTAPLLAAVVTAALGALLIETLRARGRASGDVALALLFYGGIAGGVLITGLAGGNAATLNAYLFGAITTVSTVDLVIVVALAAVVLVLALGLAPQLFAVCQDEEHARVCGLPVRLYGALIAVLAAVTVTVSMRTVGLLLVSALMVVPWRRRSSSPGASGHLDRGDARRGGGIARRGGRQLLRQHRARTLDRGAGAAGLPRLLAGRGYQRHRRRLREPFVDEELRGVELDDVHESAESHPHVHGEGCGHVAVRHGDHIDYVHAGHRHASHEDHYDEH
jgi:zinc transport system permease protein